MCIVQKTLFFLRKLNEKQLVKRWVNNRKATTFWFHSRAAKVLLCYIEITLKAYISHSLNLITYISRNLQTDSKKGDIIQLCCG